MVYTGDTKTLAPFMSFLKTADMKQKRLYTEISAYKSDVHLFIDDHLNTLIDLQRQGIDIFLMHLDNEKIVREIIKDTDLKIVETFWYKKQHYDGIMVGKDEYADILLWKNSLRSEKIGRMFVYGFFFYKMRKSVVVGGVGVV